MRLLLPTLLLLTGCNDNNINRVTRIDEFDQAPSNLVDILWVVDNSDSMEEEQSALSLAASSFLAELEMAEMDFHLGVVTTDTRVNGGVLVGSPNVLTSDCLLDGDNSDCTYQASFESYVRQGTAGDDKEKGLGAALAAISVPITDTSNAGFRRDDAPLVILILSDENDCTDQGALPTEADGDMCYSDWESLVPAPTLVHQIQDVTDHNVIMSGIIGPKSQAACKTATPGLRYAHAIQILGGTEANICDADYSPVMSSMGLIASGIRDTFQLGMTPDLDTVVVTVDPTDAEPYEVPADDLVGWSYITEYAQIHFNGSSVPPRGAVVEVAYTVAGPLPDDVETTTE